MPKKRKRQSLNLLDYLVVAWVLSVIPLSIELHMAPAHPNSTSDNGIGLYVCIGLTAILQIAVTTAYTNRWFPISWSLSNFYWWWQKDWRATVVQALSTLAFIAELILLSVLQAIYIFVVTAAVITAAILTARILRRRSM